MKKILSFVTGLILTSGIALTIGNGLMYAQVDYQSGGGATLQMHGAAPEVNPLQPTMEATNAVLPAYERANASTEMVVGILLILLGFFLHGLLRTQDERNVRVKAVPRKAKSTKKKWYYLELQV